MEGAKNNAPESASAKKGQEGREGSRRVGKSKTSKPHKKKIEKKINQRRERERKREDQQQQPKNTLRRDTSSYKNAVTAPKQTVVTLRPLTPLISDSDSNVTFSILLRTDSLSLTLQSAHD